MTSTMTRILFLLGVVGILQLVGANPAFMFMVPVTLWLIVDVWDKRQAKKYEWIERICKERKK